jgi:hypothetical protein
MTTQPFNDEVPAAEEGAISISIEKESQCEHVEVSTKIPPACDLSDDEKKRIMYVKP